MEFLFTVDGVGAPTWAYPGSIEDQARTALSWSHPKRNFPDGDAPDSSHYDTLSNSTIATTFAEKVMEAVLQQNGRHFWQAEFEGGCAARCVGPVDNATGVPMAIPNKPSCCLVAEHRSPSVLHGERSIEYFYLQSLPDATVAWNPECFDVLDTEAQYVPTLRSTMSDTLNKTACGGSCPQARPFCAPASGSADAHCISPYCSDFLQHCDDPGLIGIRARQVCPQTCGCSSPRSPLALSQPSSGCSSMCPLSGDYRSKRAALPCEDIDKNDSRWVRFIDNIANASMTWSSTLRASFMLVEPDLRQYGCDYLAYSSQRLPMDESKGKLTGYPPYLWGINRCVVRGAWADIKPFSYFCPVACGCHAEDAHCPNSCPPRDSTTALCPAWQKTLANSFPFSTTCPVASSPRLDVGGSHGGTAVP